MLLVLLSAVQCCFLAGASTLSVLHQSMGQQWL